MTGAPSVTPPLPYRVVRTSDEGHDTATLVLESAGARLPPFVPGQFAMVYAFGAGVNLLVA